MHLSVCIIYFHQTRTQEMILLRPLSLRTQSRARCTLPNSLCFFNDSAMQLCKMTRFAGSDRLDMEHFCTQG